MSSRCRTIVTAARDICIYGRKIELLLVGRNGSVCDKL